MRAPSLIVQLLNEAPIGGAAPSPFRKTEFKASGQVVDKSSPKLKKSLFFASEDMFGRRTLALCVRRNFWHIAAMLYRRELDARRARG